MVFATDGRDDAHLQQSHADQIDIIEYNKHKRKGLMEFTEDMLDVIEEVKGVRNVNYWDGRCEQRYKAKQENSKKPDSTTTKG